MTITYTTEIARVRSGSPPKRRSLRWSQPAWISIALVAASCSADVGSSESDATSSQAEALNLSEVRDCPSCPILVVLPPGTFLMGNPGGEEPASKNPDRPQWTEEAEKPQFEVQIGYPVAMGKYEVTFAEWDRCVEVGGCTYQPSDEGWGRSNRPVINVSRQDAEEYIRWLSVITGQPYRLPSEAEWEYAARAGATTARYWGEEMKGGMAVCDGCGSAWDKQSTAPVGSFPPNAFGLHDMLGNAAEWVADCWSPDHIGAPSDGSARMEESLWWKNGTCERPIKRGGAWSWYPWTIRAAFRGYYWPGPWSDRMNSQGFRVARALVQEP